MTLKILHLFLILILIFKSSECAPAKNPKVNKSDKSPMALFSVEELANDQKEFCGQMPKANWSQKESEIESVDDNFLMHSPMALTINTVEHTVTETMPRNTEIEEESPTVASPDTLSSSSEYSVVKALAFSPEAMPKEFGQQTPTVSSPSGMSIANTECSVVSPFSFPDAMLENNTEEQHLAAHQSQVSPNGPRNSSSSAEHPPMFTPCSSFDGRFSNSSTQTNETEFFSPKYFARSPQQIEEEAFSTEVMPTESSTTEEVPKEKSEKKSNISPKSGGLKRQKSKSRFCCGCW